MVCAGKDMMESTEIIGITVVSMHTEGHTFTLIQACVST